MLLTNNQGPPNKTKQSRNLKDICTTTVGPFSCQNKEGRTRHKEKKEKNNVIDSESHTTIFS